MLTLTARSFPTPSTRSLPAVIVATSDRWRHRIAKAEEVIEYPETSRQRCTGHRFEFASADAAFEFASEVTDEADARGYTLATTLAAKWTERYSIRWLPGSRDVTATLFPL